MLHRYFVYITTNENKTTIYIGMTNNIQRRLSQHFFDSQNSKKSFAGKYNCFYLIYYEGFQDPMSAILREKEIKKWRRKKKEKLINSFNPKWEFINQEVIWWDFSHSLCSVRNDRSGLHPLFITQPGHFDMSCKATIEKSRLHVSVIENR